VVSNLLFIVNGNHTTDPEERQRLSNRYNQALKVFGGNNDLLRTSILEIMSKAAAEPEKHPEYHGQNLTQNEFVKEALGFLPQCSKN
jgi:hypothetical protein